jgi:ATP-binding cassette subfamily B protein
MAGSLLFVGPSGCGKSTVFNLLMRFYDPASGTVCIDGRDIRTVTQDSVRQHIGVVLQESFLFNTTIRENIRMGKGDATDEEVEAAARTAEMHDIIVKMPQGYDTVVGERGGKLSGGQRQRIAIARAIISNPPILLLDEATSALDPATAASINQSLERISKGRTVISVTHRLEAAPGADGIFVFHEGRLAEQGRHGELLKLNGLYARLWNKQAGFSLSEDGTQARVDAARLRAVPILQELDDASLSTIARFFATEHFPPHRPVVQQGDAGDKFYIIVRGKVSVLRTEASGEEHPLAVLEDGDHFGEVALMERIPRTASVHTLTDCVFLTLQREHFLRLVEANPVLKARLEAITATRSGKQ